MHQLRGVGADVAEALDDDARAFALKAKLLEGLVADDHYAAAGGLTATTRPADVQRLAGDDRGYGLAHVHGVGVHHPCHGLLVGAHVRRGNIFFRANEFDQLGGVAASDLFEFSLGEFARIADDAAFGATERNVDDSTLPGHPTGEGADFVEIHVRRIADAALGRAAGDGMLHAKAGEDLNAAVVHANGDVNDKFAVGI